jgi:hypothetical protein
MKYWRGTGNKIGWRDQANAHSSGNPPYEHRRARWYGPEEDLFLRSDRPKAGAGGANRLTFGARSAKLGALQVR